jgi:hypothetical protein
MKTILSIVGAAALSLALLGSAQAGLLSHFKGRYGAIEVWDSGKKLSFRVNAAELSSPRGFCQTQNLNAAIAAIEYGVVKDLSKTYTRLVGANEEKSTLRVALMRQQDWLFEQINPQVNPAQLAALNAKKALLPACPASAFQILDWFKRLQTNTLPLKPATQSLLRDLLRTKRGDDRVMYNFVSRSSEATGAVGGTFGYVDIKGSAPIFFAVSVDGKSVPDLFGVARSIRDAALEELKYWRAANTAKTINTK